MAIQEFQNFIVDTGYPAPANIIPGKIIAFPGLDKRKGNTAARCFLFPDRRGGWLMDYSTGLFEVWQAKRETPYTKQERQAFREQCELARLAREAETAKAHGQTADKASKTWKRAILADAGNGYLRRKNIQSNGSKTFDTGGDDRPLIAPLYDDSLTLVNLQFIHPDGAKRFLKGGKKKGCFWWLGKSTKTVLIAEGLSTAASVFEDTGLQTFIAFDAGNLANVAKIVRAKNPDAEIIIMGDNDENGTGQAAARAAALACGGKYLIPPTVGQDFNDYLNSMEGAV